MVMVQNVRRQTDIETIQTVLFLVLRDQGRGKESQAWLLMGVLLYSIICFQVRFIWRGLELSAGADRETDGRPTHLTELYTVTYELLYSGADLFLFPSPSSHVTHCTSPAKIAPHDNAICQNNQVWWCA